MTTHIAKLNRIPVVSSARISWQEIYRYLLVLPLILFVLASFAVRYSADDLSDIASIEKRGVLGSVHWLFNNWTGRYAYGLAVYSAKLVPVWLPSLVVIGLLVTGLYLVTRHGVTAILLTLAVLSAMPTWEVFYWQSALMNYGLPISLLIWLAYAWRQKWEVAGALLVVVIIGLSDTAAMLMPVILIGWLFLQPSSRHWPTILAAVMCLVIWYTAPGNAYRQAYFTHAPLPLAIFFGIKGAGLPLANALKMAPGVLLALAILPGRWQPMARCPRLALVSSLGILAICAVAMTGFYVAQAAPPELRAQSIPVAISLMGIYILSRLYVRPSRKVAILAFIMAIVLCSARAITMLSVLGGIN